MRAQRAHEALREHAQHHGGDEVRGHAQFHHPRDGAGRIVGVQRAEHEVAGERGLHRHLGGGEVADFADHDDVRVLPHQRAQALGEAEVQLRLHLRLVERRLDHFDRVFHRAHVDLFGRHALERGVQRGGLARARGPGHQDDAVGPRDQLLPALRVVLREAQRVEVLHRGVGVEDAHHHLLAEGGRQGRQAHFDFVAAHVAGLDAAVERAALLDHVHAAQQLDARDHRVHHAHGHLVGGVQDAVDAKADHALLAARLQVDVAGALVEGVLPQPVDHLHHALVIGVELLVALAQFDQLLEARAAGVAAGLLRGAHRLGEREELGRVALDVRRVGHHAAHGALGLALDLGDPVDEERFGRGHHHLVRQHLHGQHLVALGVAGAHGVGHLAHVDLERIDAQVGQAGAAGEPLRERLEVERLAVGLARHGHVGQAHQRRLAALGLGAARDGALGLHRRDHAVGGEPFDQATQVERTFVAGSRGGSGGGYSAHEPEVR
ncbi:hypothetical protein D3C86_1067280 [compost metagenome]